MPSTFPRPSHDGLSHRSGSSTHDEKSQAVTQKDPRQRLIVALDVFTAAAAQKIVAAVGDSALTYKVGMQLYTAEGPQVVRDLVACGRRVFLDLKYHDIPNTVGAAVAEAEKLGVSMLTVHSAGSGKMLRAAVDAAKVRPELIVLAITVLTSMGEDDLDTIGMHGSVKESVVRLALDRARERMPGRGHFSPRSLCPARGTWRQIRDRHSRCAASRQQCWRSGACRDACRGNRGRSQPHRGRATDHGSGRSSGGGTRDSGADRRVGSLLQSLTVRITFQLTAEDYYRGLLAWRNLKAMATMEVMRCAYFWMSLSIPVRIVRLLAFVRPDPKTIKISAAILGFAALWFLYMWTAPRFSGRRQFRGSPSAQSPMTIDASDAGLAVHSAYGESQVSWSAYIAWAEAKSIFVILPQPRIYVPIPKRAFTAEQLNEFRELLRRNIKSQLTKQNLRRLR